MCIGIGGRNVVRYNSCAKGERSVLFGFISDSSIQKVFLMVFSASSILLSFPSMVHLIVIFNTMYRQCFRQYVRQNEKLYVQVARSVWSVVLMNISLFSSFFISVAGVIIGFGLDIVNFIIEMVPILPSLSA